MADNFQYRVPGLASMSDMGKNAWSMFNLGYNPKAFFNGGLKSIPVHGIPFNGRFSVGGVLTTGGLAVAGAGIGAALGSQMDGDMIGPMAGIGAVAGLAALPAAGLAARVGMTAGTAAVRGIGSAAIAAPRAAWGLAKGAVSLAAAPPNRFINPVSKTLGSSALGFASMMIDYDSIKGAQGFLAGLKLTGPWTGMKAGAKAGWAARKTIPGKLLNAGGQGLVGGIINGKTVLAGSALIAGAASAFQEWNKIHMGQMDNTITTPAPRTPSYAMDAGATGDLVFALNANRRG